MKLEFSRQILEKCPNTQFHENPYSGTELFHADKWTDGRTDRHGEANSRFSQFCGRAQKHKQIDR